jgi:hypothetical protein
MNKVNVDVMVKYLNDNFVGEFSVEDFNNGSGVYGIFVGSRAEIEKIYKVEDFKLKSKEELIKEWMIENVLLAYFINDEELREYGEEFIDSGEIDWNDLGGVYEGLSEEESIEYYNVEIV